MQFYGIGFNSGKYGFLASEKVNGKWKSTRCYSIWTSMLKRCYSNYKNYVDVFVNKEWHDYQDFAKWFYGKPEHMRVQGWQLDKDILNRSAREYGPSTCCLVPSQINIAMQIRKVGDCVQGVNWHKRDKFFRAFVTDVNGKHVEKNGFKTELEAFLWYKEQKESIVRQLAEKYKEVIDSQVYKALFAYEIREEKFIYDS